jgi:hypothetical protein
MTRRLRSNATSLLGSGISASFVPVSGAACKNGGWKTMSDNVPNPFKNQGDCVSFYATGEKNLASGTY